MSIKVKLVALAKDEAPYLAEWIAHHLYFGFDEIEVLVNRTTDNSESVLSKVVSVSPNVKWRSIDWIDLIEGNVSRDIQKIAYSQAYNDAKKNFTHLFFIDIDEFWIPANFKDSIVECIKKLKSPDAIYFEWANELGHDAPFQSLSKSHGYQAHELGKTLFSTSAPLNKISIHRHFFKRHESYILANGDIFEADDKNAQAVSKNKSCLKPYFILHRISRSEEEYVSLLYRGNPENHNKFKNNRFGYNADGRPIVNIEFPHEEWSHYKAFMSAIFFKWNIFKDMDEARCATIERYNLSVLKINESLEGVDGFPVSILSGLSKNHNFLTPNISFKGCVDSITQQRISGWAVSAEGKPCKLTVHINDSYFSEIFSTGERKDLLSKGISDGLGGFKFIIPNDKNKIFRVSIFFPNGVLFKSIDFS